MTKRKFQFSIIGFVMLADIFLQYFFRVQGRGVPNQGVSFGLFPGLSTWVLPVVYGLLAGWLLATWRRGEMPGWLMALGIGGLGNMIARSVTGGVWDYLQMPILPFWFNLSDVLITVGVVSYILMADGNKSLIRR